MKLRLTSDKKPRIFSRRVLFAIIRLFLFVAGIAFFPRRMKIKSRILFVSLTFFIGREEINEKRKRKGSFF